jgi:hypothetical protein
MTVLDRKVPTLSFIFAGAGAAYYLATLAQKPRIPDPLWERHDRDALFALGAGLGAGLVLWLVEA